MISTIAILKRCEYLSTIDHGKITIRNLVGTIRAIIFNSTYSDVAIPKSEILWTYRRRAPAAC